MSKPRSGVETTPRTDTAQPQRRADELFRALIENASDVITILDAEGIIRYQSPSVEAVLGYKPHELIGMDIAELLHPDDLPKWLGSYGALKAGARSGTPQTAQITEERLRHKDGSWRILESIAKVLDMPSGAGIVINSRDITERRQTEARLTESEEKFRKAFMTGTDAFYIATLNEGLLLEVNNRFEEMFGYTREDAIGKTTIQVGLWASPVDRARMVSEAKSQGFVRNMELRGRRKGGDLFPLLISENLLQESGEDRKSVV
jgi:PAS domain S-box-containing protein